MDPQDKNELTDVVSNRSASFKESESNTDATVESPGSMTATTSKDAVAALCSPVKSTALVDFTGDHKAATASGSKDADDDDVEWFESELTCSICTELYVRPVKLNCSHTYCRQCINEWREIKERCPMCQAKIITVCKSNVVDRRIGKVLESASDETKRKRKQMIDERNLKWSTKKRKVTVPVRKPIPMDDVWDIW